MTSPYEPEFIKLMLAASGSPASKKFKPALLNTVVFLVETAQQVAVMAVNYKGRPFMLAATENVAMLFSLLACGSARPNQRARAPRAALSFVPLSQRDAVCERHRALAVAQRHAQARRAAR